MKVTKANTQKLRTIVLKLMRETANKGECIGMATPDIIEGLCNSLEKDPSQWFAAGMQLMQVGLINYDYYNVLTGKG